MLSQRPLGSTSPPAGGGGVQRFRFTQPAWLTWRNVANFAAKILIVSGIILGIYLGYGYVSDRPGKIRFAYDSANQTIFVNAGEAVKVTTVAYGTNAAQLENLDLATEIGETAEYVREHQYEAAGLFQPGTKYFYKVLGLDKKGKNYATDGSFTVPTPVEEQKPGEEEQPAQITQETAQSIEEDKRAEALKRRIEASKRKDEAMNKGGTE